MFLFSTNALVPLKGLYTDYNALIRNRTPDENCDFFSQCIFKISILASRFGFHMLNLEQRLEQSATNLEAN